MATTVLGDLTDAIPLLDDNGSGVYIKGRNNARDIRTQLLCAMVAKAGSSFVTRRGVVSTSGYDTAAGMWNNFQATAAGTPNQTITLVQGRIVSERTGQGPYLITLEGSTTYTMPAADASNPRIDVVYAIGYDLGVPALGDSVHGPKIVCETGTPGSSPAVPSIPTDAYKICEVYRRTIGATPSGNVIQSGDITDKRKATSWQGTPRAIMPGDSVSDSGGYHGEVRLLVGAQVPAALIAAGTTILFEYWDATAVLWRRINGRTLVQDVRGVADFGLTTAEAICDPWTFAAIAGHSYKFEFSGGFILNTTGSIILYPRIASGGTVTTASPKLNDADYNRVFPTPSSGSYSFFECWVAPTTGNYTVGLGSLVGFGAATGTIYGSSVWGRELLITDLDY